MEEIILGLIEFALSTQYGAYVMVFLALIGLIGKILTVLPVSVTEKIPDWVMVILNVIGANYGNAVATDMKGNKIKPTNPVEDWKPK